MLYLHILSIDEYGEISIWSIVIIKFVKDMLLYSKHNNSKLQIIQYNSNIYICINSKIFNILSIYYTIKKNCYIYKKYYLILLIISTFVSNAWYN